ncbi:hypothetical protein AL480_03805 [Stenotrophomonas maltophilia]|nr:hypothetical protein AL480_03805 [Stenotrophomonas maltophilia]
MRRRYSVYSIFILDGDRRLITRHWWRWTATLWACDLARIWKGIYVFDVVEDSDSSSLEVK